MPCCSVQRQCDAGLLLLGLHPLKGLISARKANGRGFLGGVSETGTVLLNVRSTMSGP